MLTWNVWWHFGPWEARQPPSVAAVLKDVDADVVCLQEVWRGEGRRQPGGRPRRRARLPPRHRVRASTSTSSTRRSATPCCRAGRSRAASRGASPHPTVSTRCASCCARTSTGRVVRSRSSSRTSTGAWTRATSASSRSARCASSSPRRASGGRSRRSCAATSTRSPDSDEIRMMTGLAAVPVPKLVFVDAWRVGGRRPGSDTSSRAVNPFAALDLEPDRRLDYVFVGFPREQRRRSRRGARRRGDRTARRDVSVGPLRRLRGAEVLMANGELVDGLRVEPGRPAGAGHEQTPPTASGFAADARTRRGPGSRSRSPSSTCCTPGSGRGEAAASLLVLQGMDTSGKDGTIRRVLTGLNPQGCEVTSFKAPSDTERAHDYLWRIHAASARPGAARRLQPVPLRGRHRGAVPGCRDPRAVPAALPPPPRVRAPPR